MGTNMGLQNPHLIGGSDVAAICGVSPYKAPIDVWRRIVEGYQTPDNPAMMRGRLLEPVIRAMTAMERPDLVLSGPKNGMTSAKYTWARVSLDDWDDAKGQPVEFKSANIRQVSRWSRDGEDVRVPEEYMMQVQHYMLITEAPTCVLSVLLGGDELRVYDLPADKELQAMLVEACERFWRDYVLTKRPPPADASDSCHDFLTAKYPAASKPLMLAPPEAEPLARQYLAAKAAQESAEGRVKALRIQLEQLCGANEGMDGSTWRLRWTDTKGRAKTDWEALAAELKISKELIQKHTARGNGFRVFKLTEK